MGGVYIQYTKVTPWVSREGHPLCLIVQYGSYAMDEVTQQRCHKQAKPFAARSFV
jgi:hypothetical protein